MQITRAFTVCQERLTGPPPTTMATSSAIVPCTSPSNTRPRQQDKRACTVGTRLSMLLWLLYFGAPSSTSAGALADATTLNANPTRAQYSAEAQQVIDDLNSAERAGNDKELFARLVLSARSSSHEVWAVLHWLKEKLVAGNGGARYAYLYADNLFRLDTGDPLRTASLRQTAAMAMLTGMLTMRVDAVRCADRSAPSGKIQRWESRNAPVLTYYQHLPNEDQEKLLLIALQTEEKHKLRDKDKWLCSSGPSYFAEYFSKHPEPHESIKLPNAIGETVALKDDSIQPKFVSDNEWRVVRQNVVDRFKGQMLYGWIGDPSVDIEALASSGALRSGGTIIQGNKPVRQRLREDGTVEITLSRLPFTLLVPNVSRATAVQICASVNRDLLSYTDKYSDLREAPCFKRGTGMAMKKESPAGGLPLIVAEGDGHNYFSADRRANGSRSSGIYIGEIVRRYGGSLDVPEIFAVVAVDTNADGKLDPHEAQRWVIQLAHETASGS